MIKARVSTKELRQKWELHELNAIRQIQRVQGGAFLSNDMKRHSWVTLLENGHAKFLERIRVGHCQAYLIRDDRYIYVQSYTSIIGCFDKARITYYSMGAYSTTTYQHERKALKLIEERGFPVLKINLWKVDNFGEEI